MKKVNFLNYAAAFVLCSMLAVQSATLVTTLSAADSGNVNISDLISDQTGSETKETTQGSSSTTTQSSESSGTNLVDKIVDGMDYSKHESAVVDKTVKVMNYYAGIVIQILVYFITAAMTISKLIDIVYIAIPPLRTFLANGYVGNAAAAGTPSDTGMMNGGMMGGGMMGGGMMGGGRYGMGGGRYGMGGMMGGGMPGGGMIGQGSMDANMAMQNQPARGRIQLVSNAALNAVATTSVLGTDGKGQNAFKTYVPDMAISITITAALLVLCLTGVISKLGFALGNFLVDMIGKIQLGAI